MGDFQSQNFQIQDGRNLQIRHLVLGDEEAFYDFHTQAAQETKHTLVCQEKTTPLHRHREKIENAEKSSSEILLGVFAHSKIVGSLQFRVTIPDHPWAKHLGEFGMLVLKGYWNQGIGKKLLKEMETFASSIGIFRIEAKVRVNNERGVAFYHNAGFRIEGVREKGAFIDGQFVDEYFIAKIL